jgi:hypothetical protein
MMLQAEQLAFLCFGNQKVYVDIQTLTDCEQLSARVDVVKLQARFHATHDTLATEHFSEQ